MGFDSRYLDKAGTHEDIVIGTGEMRTTLSEIKSAINSLNDSVALQAVNDRLDTMEATLNNHEIRIKYIEGQLGIGEVV